MSDLSEEVEALLLNEENYEAVGVALKRWGMVAIPEGELTVLRLRAERSVPQESGEGAFTTAEWIVEALRERRDGGSEGIEKDAEIAADEREFLLWLARSWRTRADAVGDHLMKAAYDSCANDLFAALTSSRETGGTNDRVR